MSIRSLLVETIARVIQKIFHRTTPLDHNTKTEEIHKRAVGEVYDCGCSPLAEANVVRVLEHGGKYLAISNPDTKTEENHMARVIGEVYYCGCSPVAEARIVKGLKHAGKYPSINES